VIDRRSFISRIFGGLAATAAAPHIKTKPRWSLSKLKPLKLHGTLGMTNSLPGATLYTKYPAPEFEMGELAVYEGIEQIPDIELCPEFLGTENSTQDGFGVTGEREPFGATISGCPKGYY
jgi:hypothetical protein